MINLSRRRFLFCAPAVILTPGLLMRVKPVLAAVPAVLPPVADLVKVTLGGVGYQWVAVNGNVSVLPCGIEQAVERHVFEALRASDVAMDWRDGGDIGLQRYGATSHIWTQEHLAAVKTMAAYNRIASPLSFKPDMILHKHKLDNDNGMAGLLIAPWHLRIV